VKKKHAERHAETPAYDERQDQSPFKPAAKRDERSELAQERAEHRERRCGLRRERPGPERQRHDREGEARQSLDEAADRRSRRDDEGRSQSAGHRRGPRF
jgi:hypothetical protein